MQIGVDLCLKYCKCLTNDISHDFVNYFAGVFDLDYTSFHEKRREKREPKGTKHKKKVVQNQQNLSESVISQEVDLEEVKGNLVVTPGARCGELLSSVHC